MIDKDRHLKSILEKKEQVELSSGFEDNLMSKIHLQAESKNLNKKNLSRMYVFFGLGTVFGLLLPFSLQDIIIHINGMDISLNKVFLMIPLVFGLLFIFEKVYKTSNFLKGKEEIFNI